MKKTLQDSENLFQKLLARIQNDCSKIKEISEKEMDELSSDQLFQLVLAAVTITGFCKTELGSNKVIIYDDVSRENRKFSKEYKEIQREQNKISILKKIFANKNICLWETSSNNHKIFNLKTEVKNQSNSDTVNIVLRDNDIYQILAPITESKSKTTGKYPFKINNSRSVSMEYFMDHQQMLVALQKNNDKFSDHFFKIALEAVSANPDDLRYLLNDELNQFTTCLSGDQWNKIILKTIEGDAGNICFLNYKGIPKKFQEDINFHNWLFRIILTAVKQKSDVLSNQTKILTRLANNNPKFNEQIFEIASIVVLKEPYSLKDYLSEFMEDLSYEQWSEIVLKTLENNGGKLSCFEEIFTYFKNIRPEFRWFFDILSITANIKDNQTNQLIKLDESNDNFQEQLFKIILELAKKDGNSSGIIFDITSEFKKQLSGAQWYQIILEAVKNGASLKCVDKMLPKLSENNPNFQKELYQIVLAAVSKSLDALEYLSDDLVKALGHNNPWVKEIVLMPIKQGDGEHRSAPFKVLNLLTAEEYYNVALQGIKHNKHPDTLTLQSYLGSCGIKKLKQGKDFHLRLFEIIKAAVTVEVSSSKVLHDMAWDTGDFLKELKGDNAKFQEQLFEILLTAERTSKCGLSLAHIGLFAAELSDQQIFTIVSEALTNNLYSLKKITSGTWKRLKQDKDFDSKMYSILMRAIRKPDYDTDVNGNKYHVGLRAILDSKDVYFKLSSNMQIMLFLAMQAQSRATALFMPTLKKSSQCIQEIKNLQSVITDKTKHKEIFESLGTTLDERIANLTEIMKGLERLIKEKEESVYNLGSKVLEEFELLAKEMKEFKKCMVPPTFQSQLFAKPKESEKTSEKKDACNFQ